MEKEKSDNLTKGDIISFVAILLLGVAVFFGMNFKTLGDKIPSIVVAVLLVVLMTVFVFLAAYAKAQNRNQNMWRAIEYSMVGLYLLCLIPCYIYASKFFDIYLQKTEITNQVQSDINDLDKMFAEYNRKCESRITSYQTSLEALYNFPEGREKIAKMLDMSASKVTEKNIKQAAESFSSQLKGPQYQQLVAEKKTLESNILTNIKNWNIILLPQYASEMGNAQKYYATELEKMYNKRKNDVENNVPEFNAKQYESNNNLEKTFTSSASFSVLGLIAVLLLGCLGFVKYLLGEKRTVIPIGRGDTTSISDNGGMTI